MSQVQPDRLESAKSARFALLRTGNHRAVLLAFQTTSEAIDDSTLDAVTLALLVGFVVSLVALSFLLGRRGEDSPEERDPSRDAAPPAEPIPASPARPRIEPRSIPAPSPSTPAWLSGVTLPQSSAGLSEAAAVIERLLDARRNRDLAAGIALYSPSFRARLAAELGVPEDRLESALGGAAIEGDAPVLRSVELVSATADELRARIGYADRSSEIYRLVRIDGRWAIDAIERA